MLLSFSLKLSRRCAGVFCGVYKRNEVAAGSSTREAERVYVQPSALVDASLCIAEFKFLSCRIILCVYGIWQMSWGGGNLNVRYVEKVISLRWSYLAVQSRL